MRDAADGPVASCFPKRTTLDKKKQQQNKTEKKVVEGRGEGHPRPLPITSRRTGQPRQRGYSSAASLPPPPEATCAHLANADADVPSRPSRPG